jgi:RimJ/RimL family protein N-acetyltransferase
MTAQNERPVTHNVNYTVMRLRRSSDPAGLKSLRGAKIEGSKVRLREKKMSDVRTDYRWQMDPELSRLDAAEPMNVPFSFYLLDYAAELHRPRSRRFPMAIETLDGKHIGNFTVYDVDEKKGEAQLGIMIGNRDYWGQGYGADAMKAVVDHLFGKTGLARLYLKTLDWNTRAQKCFTRCGFARCGEMQRNGHAFWLMDLTRERWETGRDEGRAPGGGANGAR